MAFCSNCGNQLEGQERFCSKCGNEVTARAATRMTAPAAVATGGVSGAVASLPMQPVQTMAAVPGTYAAPGPIAMGPGGIPMAVAMPPQAPGKKGMKLSTLVIAAAIAAGGYTYYTHVYQKNHAPASSQAKGGANAALGKQQAFDAHWQTVNGFVQLSSGKWTNHSNVAIQSATLECDQYDTSGDDLDQMRTTLTGPVQPGGTDTFNPFAMGAVASNLNKVTCSIMYAKPVGQ
jgi:hypothetical protein